jgi:hypothetical protein
MENTDSSYGSYEKVNTEIPLIKENLQEPGEEEKEHPCSSCGALTDNAACFCGVCGTQNIKFSPLAFANAVGATLAEKQKEEECDSGHGSYGEADITGRFCIYCGKEYSTINM